MPDQSSTSALPATYRLGLAVSLALLAHTLLLSGLPTPFASQPDRHRESLSVELVLAGSTPSRARASSEPATERQPRPIPRFEVEPRQDRQPAPEVVTADTDRKPSPSLEQSPAAPPATAPQLATTKTATPGNPESANTSSQPASASRTGAKARNNSEQTPEPVTRITRSPVEVDPYLVKLATHLARQLEDMRVPAISQLPEPVAMEVELQLLGNGALTRARVVKSTGVANIDRAAYRAALAASPYPKPPEASPGENRFEVELLFTPKRL